MQVNDLMVKLDGTSLVDAETGELVKMVAGMRPGTVVKLEVRRGSEPVVLKVKLGPRPPEGAYTARVKIVRGGETIAEQETDAIPFE